MPNLAITFGIYPETTIVEYEGVQEGSCLWAQAAGLDIYVISDDSTRHPDCLSNMAMNACLARYIPVVSLHLVKTDYVRSNRFKTETKEMF